MGNAVTATDTDNDPLLYSLTDGDEGDAEGIQYEDSDTNEDTPATDGDSQWFSVSDKTGQISVSTSKSQSDVMAEFNQDVEEPNG